MSCHTSTLWSFAASLSSSLLRPAPFVVAIDDAHDRLGAAWLTQGVVCDLRARRPDGEIDLTGQEYAKRVGLKFLDALEQGKPVHGGHPHVGHDGVEGPSSKALEGGLTVCRRHENPFPPQSAKVTSQGLEDGRLIVDRQYRLS
jgi:hypothetical protein